METSSYLRNYQILPVPRQSRGFSGGNKGITEGNAWHCTWFVPHDVEGLVQLFGNRDAFTTKLNHAFELAASPDPTDPALAPFARGEGHGYVCYANQPCLHMAHLFNYPGGQFVIVTQNNSKQNKYIQSATLDGKPLNRPWFHHRQPVDGGTLRLKLGPQPNKQWGSRPEDTPPSMTSELH